MKNETINRVELQGRVGTVRISSCADMLIANFSIQTEHMITLKDGAKVCEVTWMPVAAFEGGKVNTHGLTRGSLVHLTGRLRTNRYTAADGGERIFTEVLASTLEVLD